jgi:6-pyruvoyltetrahydropterin/6-carboxytetrahydropterin synthase
VHGHSFRAEVAVGKRLDHKLLNKIEGLGKPTLENLARYICEEIAHVGPVTRVTITRESCAEACTYRPNRK